MRDLRHEVEAAARAAWPVLAGAAGMAPEGARLEVVRTRVSDRSVRTVLRVDGPGALILKHAPDETPDWFDTQVAAHDRASAAFAGAGPLGVPRLLASDRSRRALLMERVGGETLQDAMAASDGAGRLRLLELAGRWMGHLHRSGEVRFQRVRPARVLRQLDEWEAALADGSMAVPRPDAFLALLARVRAMTEAARGAKDMRCVVHGDMNLRNLMVDGDRIWGIDFGTMGLQPPATDLARVLVWHGTFFGPVDGDPVDTWAAAREALLAGHGGRWRDRTGLDYLQGAELLLLWRSMPASVLDRGLMHHRRWAGVKRMAARVMDGA